MARQRKHVAAAEKAAVGGEALYWCLEAPRTRAATCGGFLPPDPEAYFAIRERVYEGTAILSYAAAVEGEAACAAALQRAEQEMGA